MDYSGLLTLETTIPTQRLSVQTLGTTFFLSTTTYLKYLSLTFSTSPIQPGWVPPNVKFEIDDYEQEWVYKKESFDYIHGRNIVGAVKDWPALIKQAYE